MRPRLQLFCHFRNTFQLFRKVLFAFSGHRCFRQKHCFVKPVQHLRKTDHFGRSRAGSGCFRGPPWKPWGLPGGAKGGCQEVFGGSICVLEGLSVVAGATLGPERSPLLLMTAPWGFILVHFVTHFVTFLRFSVLRLLRTTTKQNKKPQHT